MSPELEALRARVTELERSNSAAQAASRTLTADNARLRDTLASVSQAVGRVVTPTLAPPTTVVLTATPPPAAAAAATAVAQPGRPVTAPTAPASPATNSTTVTSAPLRPAAATSGSVAPGAPAAAAPRSHTIAAGDTLSSISLRYYGTTTRWQEILAANSDVLRGSTSLVAGRTLRIP